MTKGIFYNEFETSYIPEILHEIYRDRIYKPYLEGKKDLTVIDVGANIGLFTLYASQFAKRVYSIEPAQEHVDIINKMAEFNGIADKTTVIKKALANTNGEMTLYHNDNVTMFSLKGEVNGRPDDAEKVEVTTIEKLFADNKIGHVDFLKLDVEGVETEVICGDAFEKVAGKIDAMVVEWHSWSGSNPSQLATALSDYGFKVTPIKSDATLFGAVRK